MCEKLIFALLFVLPPAILLLYFNTEIMYIGAAIICYLCNVSLTVFQWLISYRFHVAIVILFYIGK